MELIKQIKEAENKAKNLVEDAQKYASSSVENEKQDINRQLEQAAKQRKEALAQAIMQGEMAGLDEAGQLRKQSAQAAMQLGQKAMTRMDSAAAMVINFIKKKDAELKS
jgi:vacuolar-type H+-ATPase subunit H